MRFALFAIVEAAILASSLSLDAFTAGFAYGSKNIKIPFASVQIIDFICSLITGLSFFAGAFLKPYLPQWVTLAIAFSVLFIIGTIKLLDSITKSIIRRYNNIDKEIKISMFNFKFILNIYANPEDADADYSKNLSGAEAAALALSLSLDGIAVGFGAALVSINGTVVFLWSLISNAIAIIMGWYVGNKMAEKLQFNISWLGGIVLIGLAFSKFF